MLTLHVYPNDRYLAQVPAADGGVWNQHLIGFDEALGVLSEQLFGGPPQKGTPLELRPGVEYRLTISRTRSGHLIQHSDGRFAAHLDPCECLGFVASWLITGRGTYGGFRTYEQEVARDPWLFEAPPRILLPAPCVLHTGRV